MESHLIYDSIVLPFPPSSDVGMGTIALLETSVLKQVFFSPEKSEAESRSL